MATVANIGAGTGSYEPTGTVIAVEPSRVMIGQRPAGSAPAVQAVAEYLPIRSHAVDAALAVLTIHHRNNLDRGIAEMERISRQPGGHPHLGPQGLSRVLASTRVPASRRADRR